MVDVIGVVGASSIKGESAAHWCRSDRLAAVGGVSSVCNFHCRQNDALLDGPICGKKSVKQFQHAMCVQCIV